MSRQSKWPMDIADLQIEEYTPRDTEQNQWVLAAYMRGKAETDQAHDLLMAYASACERVRRHKRTMRENKCSYGPPCWVDLLDGSLEAEEMCGACLLRQVGYHFRKIAVADAAKIKRQITRYAKLKKGTL